MRHNYRMGRLAALFMLLIMLCNGLCLGIEVKAADSEFLIEDGVLLEYRGTKSKVTIPKSVTEIGERAFAGAETLKSVTIPKNVTKIGNYAFSGCSKLKEITIPKTVTEIGATAFSETVWLKNKQKKNPLVVDRKSVV